MDTQHLSRWTEEMEKLFIERSKHHQFLVRDNLLRMDGYLGLSYELLQNAAAKHDVSKFQEPERSAYIWMTWMYHCKNNAISFTYPPGIETLVEYGWKSHISNNSHHPEAHVIIDAMNDLDVVEMVCDWTAIHQEMNKDVGSCMVWAKNALKNKWRFSTHKQNLIYATIQELDRRTNAIVTEVVEVR
jgi:hypothetical protein